MPLSQYKTLPGESGVQGKPRLHDNIARERDRENVKIFIFKNIISICTFKNQTER